MFHGELRVSLRGGEALVAEHFLDSAQIGAFLKQMRSERVTQSMRVNVGREAFGDRDLLDDSADAARGEASAALIDQQSVRFLLVDGKLLAARRKIAEKRRSDGAAKRQIAFLFSFASNDNGFCAQASVLQGDPDQLRATNAAA